MGGTWEGVEVQGRGSVAKERAWTERVNDHGFLAGNGCIGDREAISVGLRGGMVMASLTEMAVQGM